NLDEIAAVEGIDVIHIGANDLLVSMGKPGRFDDPAILDAQQRVIEAARRHGKFAGCGGIRDPKRQAEVIGRGVRFVTTQADSAFLGGAARQWVDTVRGD
ncbi:MAG: aldolase, partial [Gammaproteobacteria bacterium]|nr:aldolase [Gammaproteobacteria bacterium]